MTEQSEVQEPNNPDHVSKKEPETYPDTVWKSSYRLGEHLLTLFVNFRKADGDKKSFSFIIKKGKWPTYYNLTVEEKIPFAKAVLRHLSPEERNQLLNELR